MNNIYKKVSGTCRLGMALLVCLLAAVPFRSMACTPSTTTVNDTICASQLPFAWNGKTVAAGGTAVAIDTITLTGGCDSIVTLNLVVVTSSYTGFTVTPNSFTMCNGGNVALTAASTVTAYSENFNASPTGWTVSGGTSSTQWTLRNSPYAASGGKTFNSADQTQFYMADANSGGNTTIDDILTSPSFSLANLSSATLTYDSYLDKGTHETEDGIEISVNGGSTWTEVSAPATQYPAALTLTNHTVDLTPYAGQSNVMIRFNYYTTYGYYWAIDNVIIKGTPIVKWSPATAAFTNAGLTTAYTGTATNTIYVAPVNNDTAAATTVYTASVGFCPIAQASITVNPNVGTPVFALGDSSARCQGIDTISYAATATGNTGITYALDNTTAAFTGNNINVATGVVNYAFGWSGVSIITATATGCNGPTVATHTVITKALPLQPGAFVTMTDTLCQGKDSVVYMVPNDSTVTYTWSYTGTGASITGTGDSVQMHFSDTAISGTVQVTATNSCAVSAPRIDTVVVKTLPVVSIAGTTSICTASTTTLTASGAIDYSWSPSATLSASTGNSVTASPIATTTYVVTGTTNGCSSTATTTVMVNALPNDTLIVFTPNVICAGGTLLMQTVVDTSYSYQWQLNGVDIAGAKSAFYSATTAGKYNVRITTSNGCTINTTQTQINAAAAPAPVVAYMGAQLCITDTGLISYQWYLNGTAVANDTVACITPATGGDFSVAVMNKTGCSATSPVFHLNVGVNNIVQDQIKLYPNPATNVVNVSASDKVNVSLSTIDGRQVLYVKEATTIDISKLDNAVYLIKVYDKNNTLIKVDKLVKTGL